jgi:hypothetical protein
MMVNAYCKYHPDDVSLWYYSLKNVIMEEKTMNVVVNDAFDKKIKFYKKAKGWMETMDFKEFKQTLTDVSDEIIEPTDDGEWSMILLRKIRSLQINLDDIENLKNDVVAIE